MEEDFRAALLDWTGLAAIVDDRVDWGLRNGVPAVRLQVAGKSPFYTFSGRDGLTPYIVQADCFGRDFGEAKLVARQVEACADALARPTFQGSFIVGERDDEDTDGADQVLHRTSLDIRILHRA